MTDYIQQTVDGTHTPDAYTAESRHVKEQIDSRKEDRYSVNIEKQ